MKETQAVVYVKMLFARWIEERVPDDLVEQEYMRILCEEDGWDHITKIATAEGPTGVRRYFETLHETKEDL